MQKSFKPSNIPFFMKAVKPIRIKPNMNISELVDGMENAGFGAGKINHAFKIMTLAVGVSRIYLGYHYLTDVVAGLLAGIAWLLVVGAAFNARPRWWHWGGRSTHPDRPST
jgi:deoxyhypusine synthase